MPFTFTICICSLQSWSACFPAFNGRGTSVHLHCSLVDIGHSDPCLYCVVFVWVHASMFLLPRFAASLMDPQWV